MTEEEMRVSMRKKYREHFNFAWSLFGVAQDLMGRFKGENRGPYERVLVLATGKAFKSYHSILKLCEIAYAEDAGVVLRSLFNLLVIVRWLSAGDREARAAKYLAWFWVAMHAELQTGVPASRGLAEMVEEKFNECKHLFEYQADGKTKLRDKWHRPEVNSIADMAAAVELKEHYEGLYKPLSSVEHSDALAYFGMISKAENEAGCLELSLHSDLFVPTHLQNAFQYFSDIMRLWNQAFQTVPQEKLEELFAEGTSFFKDQDNAREAGERVE